MNRQRLVILGSLLFIGIVAIAVFLMGNDAEKDNESEAKTYRVAILDSTGTATVGFKAQMMALGYTEGDNIEYIVPLAESENPAADVLAQDPDLIFCVVTPVCVATQQATAENKTPVVFTLVSDPIGAGLVQDFTKPGGNMTGVASVAVNSTNEGRRLEWLLEIDPTIERVLILYDPNDPSVLPKLAAVQSAATTLAIELVYQEVTTPEEVTAAIENLPADVQGLFTFSQRVFTTELLTQLAQKAIAQKIRYAAPGVETGALVSYSSDIPAMSRQAATLGDKILQGADPANIPVETAEFFLSINLVTAQASGLEVSDEILRQATTIVRE